jgi:LPXTG-motif cell wall-anchored protein
MMKFFFLDMPPEPSLVEKAKGNSWLLVIAIAALVAIIGFFIWRRRRNKGKTS